MDEKFVVMRFILTQLLEENVISEQVFEQALHTISEKSKVMKDVNNEVAA